MVRAYPYRRPPEDVVSCSAWAQIAPEGEIELGSTSKDWDYGTILNLRRKAKVDGARLRQYCGLGHDSVVALSVRWTATASLLRGRAWQQNLPNSDNLQVEVAFGLPGAELGGALKLQTSLVLLQPGTNPARTAPIRPGSLLWNDELTVDLRGDGVRFPIAVGNFADLHYPTEAAWYLDIGIDLEAAALGTVLLVVNEDRRYVVEALLSAGHPSEGQEAVLSALRCSVLGGLLERAVADRDFEPHSNHAMGSLAALLTATLRTRLPDIDIESLRRERDQEPEMFSARVQAAARLFASTT